jgi:glycosyltransferase involved in cell wall biosynthesis
LAEQLRIGDTVRWLGDISQADLAAEYAGADLFCLPSVQEGFGIVFLEAMAAGKPIVAARASAVPEVVTQGLLVDPDNEQALAAGIERLYRDADLRRQLGGQGLARVKQFDAPRVAARFVEEVRRAIFQSRNDPETPF